MCWTPELRRARPATEGQQALGRGTRSWGPRGSIYKKQQEWLPRRGWEWGGAGVKGMRALDVRLAAQPDKYTEPLRCAL